MFYPAELVYKNYMPDELEKGMLFMKIYAQGTIKERIEVYTLDKVPFNKDQFLSENGAPIELFIMDDDGEVLAIPAEIAWFDLGEAFMTLTDISLKEINIILNDYDGLVEIEIDDEDYEEGYVSPSYQMDKVTLRFLTDYDEEEDNLSDWNITINDGLNELDD
jgi:hypothetical protein